MNYVCCLILQLASVPACADPATTLPRSKPLTEDGDLSQKMLDGPPTRLFGDSGIVVVETIVLLIPVTVIEVQLWVMLDDIE